MFRKLAAAATIAALALLTRTPVALAQKALVYCPVGVDATGCDRIVTALTPKFTDGVDRGYDGSAGTIDLAKADLHHYSVFVVPSLADDGDKQPYALLRKVASRLHYAINGRVAVYSGAPDQGNSNRADKDALIQNLASWASDGHTRKAGLVGMVALLDLSEDESARYSWVREASLVDVSADTEDQSIGEATPVGTRGGDLLKVGGRALAFSNMASNGLHIGNRGAARTEIGAIGGATTHQSVLVTYSNADGPGDGLKVGKVSSGGGASMNLSAGKASLDVTGAGSSATSGATLTTDKADYQPGDTVTFTGAGFASGDTVTITVHEDPTWSYPDRQFRSVADANGAFLNRQMIVDEQDLNATFTATAVGNPSGTVAQTTFTDGNATSVSGTVKDASTNSPLAGVTVSCTTTSGCNNNFSTTTNASGNYVFDNSTSKLSFGGNGPTTLTLSFSKSGYTTDVLPILNVSNSNSFTGENIALTPSCTAASISVNPTNLTKNALQSASFSVTAAGSSPTYQWQVSTDNGVNFAPLSDGGAISGATTATLTINPVSGTDNGKQYRVVVTASCGSPATSTAATLTVNKLSQSTVTVTAPSSVTFGTTGTATATGGDGTGAYSFSTGASTGCSVVGTTVSVTNASGTCSLTATRAGDNDYNVSSSSAAFPVTLAKATQAALSLTVPTSITYGATGTATASGGSGTGALTFSAGASTGCSIDASTGVISVSNASGSCDISASKAGDTNYNGSVSDGPKPVGLVKANQSTVTVTQPTSVTFGTTGTAVATGGDGTGVYSFSAGSSTGCSVAGTTVSVSNASGTCSLTATRAGDNNYNISAQSAALAVTLVKASQAPLSLTVPGSITYGTTGTATASGGSGTGALTFNSGASTGCSVDGTTGVISVSNASGTCTISASKTGDNNYNGPVSDGPKNVTLAKANQSTVTVTAPGSVTFGTTGTAAATGGDGTGTYSFSAGASTGCSVVGTTVSVTNASGTCSLTATRAGDNNYNVSSVSAAFTVTLVKATQALFSLTAPASVTYGTTVTATVSGGSGTGAVAFSAGASTGCSVDGSTGVISVTNASGTCSISASKAGDNNYLGPVSDGPKYVTLVKANQSAVSVTAPSSVTYGTTGTAVATGGDGTGAYSFSAGASTGCSVVGTTVSVSNASGTCDLTATRAGDNNYNVSSSSAAFTVTLLKATQAPLSLNAPASITYGTTGTATASGGSGTGTLSFSAGGSTGCSIDASTGVISVSNASGMCAISASKAGDNNYLGPVSDGPKTVTLVKANQSGVTVTAPSSVTFGTTGTAVATGGDGTGAYSFNAGASTGCSVVGTTVSVSNASGTCALATTRAGDNNYNVSSPSVAFTVTLLKATQAPLNLTVPASVTYGATGTASVSGGSGTGAVSFSAGASTGCSVDGMTAVISVNNASGTCDISVSKAGDNNYLGPISDGPKAVPLVRANQSTVTVTAPPSVTFGTTGTAAASGGDGTGAYGFSAGASTGCSVSGTTVSVLNASLTCSLTATRAGDNNYNASSQSAAFIVTLLKATQTPLSLTVPVDVTYGSTGTATVTGGSGTGALTFSAGASTGCSVNAGTGVISVSDASGNCAVSASKAGDDNYLGPVSDGPKSVTLKKADQAALSLTVPASVTYGTTGTATVTGGSGTGVVTFGAGASTGCSVDVSTGVISVSNASNTCAISASKAGDNNYNGPVSDGPKSVALVKANQSAVSVTAPSSVTFLNTGTAAATGGNGTGGYSFGAGASTGCSVIGTTVSVSNASGSCSLTATRSGDDNYNVSSPSAAFTVTLVKATQTITFLALSNKINGDADFTVSASASSGLAVSFGVGATDQCTISGSTVHIAGAGGCTVTASQSGNNNYFAAASVPQSFTIAQNQAPILGAINLSTTDPVQKGTTLSLTSSFTDADVPQSAPYTVVINWGDGSTPTTQSGKPTPGSISASHTYSATGVFTVTVSVTDKINTTVGSTQTGTYQYAVIYDPSAGFVTGGGWINSPANACWMAAICVDASGNSLGVTGKANFGFTSKYQKGANVPTGNTEFQFQEGNLNFKSTDFQWLVIQGSTKSQFKGTGTINGSGTYNFMVTAIDGDNFGNKKPDAFRIKIIDAVTNVVVYDNQLGTDETGDSATTLGGGSIVIHDK